MKAVTGKPIKFTGMGEKLDALEPFFPDRMASRILGMGDMLGLIERAEAAGRHGRVALAASIRSGPEVEPFPAALAGIPGGQADSGGGAIVGAFAASSSSSSSSSSRSTSASSTGRRTRSR